MSNGGRHALGVIAGLILPALVAAGLAFGIGQISTDMAQFRAPWVGFGVLVLTAIVLAFLLGSRISPIASIMGGLAFTAIGIMPPLEITTGVHLLPNRLLTGIWGIGLQSVLYTGTLLLLGVAMLVVSTFPSRWRSSRPAVQPSAVYGGPSPYQPGPAGPAGSPGIEDATRPMHRD